ncbi:MAG: sn-glycerol-1-phosphate dehydrogenase [Thermoguttaceae bacterium]
MTVSLLKTALEQADTTRHILVGEGTLAEIGPLFRRCFSSASALIVGDPNTMKAAGYAIREQLQSENLTPVENVFVMPEKNPVATQSNVDQLVDGLRNRNGIAIAVGSGTINDLVKLASSELHRPYMVCATAASMDGYTAYGAPIEINGFKKTVFCPAPVAVLADLNVLANAPYTLTAAGYGDLIAKITAGADWILADWIGVEAIEPIAWKMVQGPLRSWIAKPELLVQKDKTALFRLLEGLLISGLAMQRAKTSRTASGAEHLFSHFWDNEHHTFEGTIPLHGFKVGVGTVLCAEKYEDLLRMETEELQQLRQKVLEKRRSWTETELLIAHSFSAPLLVERVKQESREKYVDEREFLGRFDHLTHSWSELKSRLREQLLSSSEIRDHLKQVGAPTRPEEMGINADLLRRTWKLTPLIRSRFTLVDLLEMIGKTEIEK